MEMNALTFETKLINLCEHSINVLDCNQNTVVIQPSGTIARIKVTPPPSFKLGDIAIFRDGDERTIVEGLPPKRPNTYYIVSLAVRNACPTRYDLLVPGVKVYDTQGDVSACVGLKCR